jgi:adenylate cyclase
MDTAHFVELSAWITEAGLAGQSETAILAGFCEREVARGLPLARALVLIDTLHPIYEGRAFRWTRAQKETTLTEYGRTDDDLSRWQHSPFYRLEESGESLLRRRLTAETEAEFSIFPELRVDGVTDYVAIANRFAADEAIGGIDCVYSSWATDASQGFTEDDIANLCRLMPFLALAVKTASLARIAGTLVETYLGRDPGRRVLQGRIARGVAEQIEAVLWFSDLRGYTRISDTAPPGEIIPLLNHYADAIISAIHERGGDVLKLMGDGVLAIFTAEDRGRACDAALTAALAARHA